MQEYPAITRMLQDPCLSLVILYHDINEGIKHIRTAWILEPNPNKGRYVEMGDQSYCEGDARAKRGFEFDGRDTLEALDLLERACNGEKGVENTVKKGKSGMYLNVKEGHVDGYSEPRRGLDNWIRADLNAIAKTVDGKLITSLWTRNFNSRNIVVAETRTDSVGQGLAPYEQHPQEMSDILHIKRGDSIQGGIKRNAILERPDFDLGERARESFDKAEFLERYESALQRLAPLNITQEARNALFTSMLIDALYGPRVAIPAIL